MITVVKEFTFDSAHFLPNYEGACNRIHGHTYKLQIGVKGEIDPDTGMVIDFKKLNGLVDNLVIRKMDHQLLNNIADGRFPANNPTAELMSQYIFAELQANLPDGVIMDFVKLWETPTSYAICYG